MPRLRFVVRPWIPEGLLVPPIAYEQDGVFTRLQARSAGWSDDVQRRLLRDGWWVPITSSTLRHRDTVVGPWQRARAVSMCRGLVVSHATAGQLWGLATSDRLEGTSRWGRQPPGVQFHRHPLARSDVVSHAGLCVTSPMRTLTDLMCALPESDAVTVLTRALQKGFVGAGDLRMAAQAAKGRTGAPRARALATSMASEPHSVLEWRFHRRVRELGSGWRFNAEIHDDKGLIGVVDAVHGPSRTIIELDGERFHGPERFQSDRTRDQRLAALGYVVLRFTWADLEYREAEVMEIIRRTIAQRMRKPAAA